MGGRRSVSGLLVRRLRSVLRVSVLLQILRVSFAHFSIAHISYFSLSGVALVRMPHVVLALALAIALLSGDEIVRQADIPLSNWRLFGVHRMRRLARHVLGRSLIAQIRLLGPSGWTCALLGYGRWLNLSIRIRLKQSRMPYGRGRHPWSKWLRLWVCSPLLLLLLRRTGRAGRSRLTLLRIRRNSRVRVRGLRMCRRRRRCVAIL